MVVTEAARFNCFKAICGTITFMTPWYTKKIDLFLFLVSN